MRGICAEPGCPWPPTYKGRCKQHARTREREIHPNKAIYGKARWRRTRRAYLHEHSMCERGCGQLASDVHHRQALQAGGEPFDMHNLEALCHECHARVTRQEQMA